MELRRYIVLVRRWAWLLVLGATVAGALAFLYSRQQTPIYEATTTLVVSQSPGVAGVSYNDVLATQQILKTYSQQATSGPVLDEVVGERLGLSYSELRGVVSTRVQRDSQLFDISVRHADPAFAATVANDVATALIEQVRAAQVAQQSTAERELNQEAATLQERITERQLVVTRLNTAQPGLTEEQRVRQLNGALTELNSLNQSLFTLQSSLQQLRIERLRTTNALMVLDPARVPEASISPRVGFNVFVGAFFGLLAAIGFVAVREFLDDTVTSADDVTRLTGAALLSSIASFQAPHTGLIGRHTKPHLLTFLSSRSPIAEAYRVLRTNLEFTGSGGPHRAVLVTSALPGEGKSTTAANLAITLAQSGRRVILVDADLRNPSQHKLFDLPNTAGLSTMFLMDAPSPPAFLRPTAIDSLSVLSSGPLPPNPAELLGSAKMDAIMALLRAEADTVILDSPPLLTVTDPAVIARVADGVILVAAAGRTRTGALTRAAEVLSRAHATLWGVVLNKVKANRGEGHYYNAEYYGRDDSTPATASQPASFQPRSTNGSAPSPRRRTWRTLLKVRGK